MGTDQGWLTLPYWMSLRVFQMWVAMGPASSPVGSSMSCSLYTMHFTGDTTTAVPAPKASSS